MNSPRSGAGSAAERVLAWLVIDDSSRFCSRAPTAAVPMTRPTCRTVFSTPDAAPASCGWTLRMATVIERREHTAHAEAGHEQRGQEVLPGGGRGRDQRQPAHPAAEQQQSKHQDVLAADLVGQAPGHGRDGIETSEAGAIARPAFSAEKPVTDCR